MVTILAFLVISKRSLYDLFIFLCFCFFFFGHFGTCNDIFHHYTKQCLCYGMANLGLGGGMVPARKYLFPSIKDYENYQISASRPSAISGTKNDMYPAGIASFTTFTAHQQLGRGNRGANVTTLPIHGRFQRSCANVLNHKLLMY